MVMSRTQLRLNYYYDYYYEKVIFRTPIPSSLSFHFTNAAEKTDVSLQGSVLNILLEYWFLEFDVLFSVCRASVPNFPQLNEWY